MKFNNGGNPIRPMDAVAALYGAGDAEVADAIISSLGKSIFDRPAPRPAGVLKRALARLSYRIMKRTTVRVETKDGTYFQNRLLERSCHPYARSLLASSSAARD